MLNMMTNVMIGLYMCLCAYVSMSQTPQIVADFTVPESLMTPRKKACRFPPNPGKLVAIMR